MIQEIIENPAAAGLLFFLAAFIGNRVMKMIKLLNKVEDL